MTSKGTGEAAMLGYSALLGLGLLASAPWWLLRMVTSQRYREGLGERLGRVPARLREAVAGRRVVWFHAVSVGEVLAISRLLNELEFALSDSAEGTALSNQGRQNSRIVGSLRSPHLRTIGGGGPWQMVISTTTRTGQALARERFGAERVFYLPLDFAWAMRAYLRVLHPAMVVLAESEIWPRLLAECERGGVPVAVVNARVSDRSFRRAWRVRAVWGRVLRRVSLWLAQSEEDARRLVELGAAADAVQVSGNLKFDVGEPKASAVAELLREALADRPVIVAGSTVEGEEELVLGAFGAVLQAESRAVLVIAPRHPERFAAVLELAESIGAFRATKCSEEDFQRSLEVNTRGIVLDTIGDLAAVYKLADVAFVGGSLVAKGGHNPLEPAQFGVPVVMGPSFVNFRDIVGKMQGGNGIRIVSDSDELASTLKELLSDPAKASGLGQRGKAVFEREQGATARSLAALLDLLPAPATRPALAAVTA